MLVLSASAISSILIIAFNVRAISNQLTNRIVLELSNTPNLVGRHFLAIAPLIIGVSLDPETKVNLVDREPPVVSHFLFPQLRTLRDVATDPQGGGRRHP